MLPVITLMIGLATGAVAVYLLLLDRQHKLKERAEQYDARAKQLLTTSQQIKAKEQELERHQVETLIKLRDREKDIDQKSEELEKARTAFASQAVPYNNLVAENLILKRDLKNLDLHERKISLDSERLKQRQTELDARSLELGSRYLKDSVKWIGSSLTSNNFALCKQKLQDVIERCRAIGFQISAAQEAGLIEDLKADFEKAVRAEVEREEQARIKAQIREEERLQREVDRELQQLERERAAIQAALAKAMADTKQEHGEEIERLKARLAEAEAKSQKAISQAQLTKAGHVYVISNIGSFGEGVYKVGMTRRLDPKDRVQELSDASVPFPFDIHMMISSTNAPGLENALHRAFHKLRINKVNPRKEFFKTDLDAILKIVREHHGEVEYVADVEALEYRQSLTVSESDLEYIESVYTSQKGALAPADD